VGMAVVAVMVAVTTMTMTMATESRAAAGAPFAAHTLCRQARHSRVTCC